MSRAADTPMLVQYRALKAEHPDCLLFFRLGDFYELFFDDARQAAPALDVALTRRPQSNGVDMPMCGVPAHAVEPYLQKLVRAGFKVAICEQAETPAEAKRRGGAKAMLRREIVRLVTPGTLTEDGLLDARRHNHLAALAATRERLGLAWLDLSTGAFATQALEAGELGAALAAVEPGELLVSDAQEAALDGTLDGVLAEWRARTTPLPAVRFDSVAAERRLKDAFGVGSLEGFGRFERAELAAAGALVDYVELTQRGRLGHLLPPKRVLAGAHMAIDPATRRNLELLAAVDGGRRGSLLHAVDRTVTAAGGRLLAARLVRPLTDVAAIRRRVDRVAALLAEPALRRRVREELRGCPDLERALARLALGRGGPRDLAAVRTALERAAALRALLTEQAEPSLAGFAERLEGLEALAARLAAVLVDQPPVLARDGGLARDGALAELDEARALQRDGRKRIGALEARYRERTGIATLKIRHNNLIGYHVEVGAAQRARVPDDFVQRQSMANATRYTTAELLELAEALDGAGERALAIERALFDELVAAVTAEAAAVSRIAATLARLDVAAALAELAEEQAWARPELSEATDFRIEGGRHPVVEQALADAGERFVANDADLAPERRLWLLTGPNMAGKSTFLRQNALIAMLAQTGSYVPARAATIGVVDRLFSRVGAADDIARGRSTFMVEMVETAAILNQASARSLVILDEIGRGTATFDGLSIAWAVVEHLHDVVRCRALFATHYHELTALAGRLDRLVCRTMRVREWRGEIRFLHEVAEGGADRSYGIHVARLAGLPKAVLARAEQVLAELEAGATGSAAARLADDLPLFAALRAAPPPTVEPAPDPVRALLAAVRADDLSPREALDLIYRLKAALTADRP